jgi:hypothetical protein
MKALKIVLKVMSVLLLIWAALNLITGVLTLLSAAGLSDFASGTTEDNIGGVFLLATGVSYFMISIAGFKDLSDPAKGRVFLIWSAVGIALSVIGLMGIVSATLNSSWPVTSLILIAACVAPGIIIQRIQSKRKP